MNPQARWHEEPVIAWLNAISFPAIPWVKPFLPQLGLPAAIVQHPEEMTAVRAAADEHYKALLQNPPFALNVEDREAAEDALSREVVGFAMERLGKTFDPDVASAFEHWARRAIVSRDWGRALMAWRSVLRRVVDHDPASRTFVPPPASLTAQTAHIESWLDPDREERLEAEVEEASPPPTVEEQSLGLDVAAHAATLEEAARHEWTTRALQTLAENLSADERAELVSWAKAQWEKMGRNPDLISDAQLSPESA